MSEISQPVINVTWFSIYLFDQVKMVNLFVSGSNTDFIFVNFLSIFLEVITLLSKQFYFIYFLAVFFCYCCCFLLLPEITITIEKRRLKYYAKRRKEKKKKFLWKRHFLGQLKFEIFWYTYLSNNPLFLNMTNNSNRNVGISSRW